VFLVFNIVLLFICASFDVVRLPRRGWSLFADACYLDSFLSVWFNLFTLCDVYISVRGIWVNFWLACFVLEKLDIFSLSRIIG